MKAFQGQTAYYGAGQFRQYLSLMVPVYNTARDEIVLNAQGLPTYVVSIQFWGALEPALVTAMRAGAAMVVEADREISLGEVIVRTRYMPGVTVDTSMQVYNPSSGLTYDVRSVSDIAAAQRELHIVCRVVK
jgi:head-tail adaptor